MACGAKLNLDKDFEEIVMPLLKAKDKRQAAKDPDFLNDLSIPIKLNSGYEIWQPNNETNSHVYLILQKVCIESGEEEEYIEIKSPAKRKVDDFMGWLATTEINKEYKQYLVLDYRA